jgi:CubicO group peptidase (beta-lactamase class C family)
MCGLVSTAGDYLRFCEAMRLGGSLGEVRLLGPKTVQLMRSNHLPGGRDLADVSVSMFSEATYRGVGFGLGLAMTTDVARTGIAGSLGEYWWGGAASTAFWIDPVEDICVVFLTQFMPSSLYPIRRELRTLVNAAILDSKA